MNGYKSLGLKTSSIQPAMQRILKAIIQQKLCRFSQYDSRLWNDSLGLGLNSLGLIISLGTNVSQRFEFWWLSILVTHKSALDILYCTPRQWSYGLKNMSTRVCSHTSIHTTYTCMYTQRRMHLNIFQLSGAETPAETQKWHKKLQKQTNSNFNGFCP